MKKVSLGVTFCFFLLFTSVLQTEDSPLAEVSPESIEYQSGYNKGFGDAMNGIQSRCVNKQNCPSKYPYERGYKLGYKKGIHELNKQGIRPLVDSPGKTIGSDFNGDGIHDFIVGAYGSSSNTGAAYVFFGASTISGEIDLAGVQSADVTILGKSSGDKLSFGLASAGDINGDGLDDLIAGSPLNTGRTYIFFGATDLSGTKDLGGAQSADITILGGDSNDQMGVNASGAGDVNGDGFDDIIVGERLNDAGGSNTGAAFIVFGTSTLSGDIDFGGVQSPDVTILGAVDTDYLGGSVSSAGDVNGDGFDDFITGAFQNDDGPGTLAGSAYVFFGAADISGTFDMGGGVQSADVTIIGKADGDKLGEHVSGLGDINGDGFDDFIVGAKNNDDGTGDNAGAAYIFFGASNLSGTKELSVQSADVTILGKADGDAVGGKVSGRGVSGARDVNDDGFDDVIVGAYGNNDGGANDEGAAYILFGGSDLSGTKNLGGGASADVTFLGKASSDNLGHSVSGIGDVNADGFPDVVVGAPGLDVSGGAYVFFGATTLSGTKDTGDADEDVRILGKASGDIFGRIVGGGRSNPGP